MTTKTVITKYSLGWKPETNQRKITLRLADYRRIEVPVDSVEEFLAIAAVLNQSPVYYYPDGSIIGEDEVN